MRTTTEIINAYRAECREIAEQCEAEGYPSHGSNYDLRTDGLWENWYADEYRKSHRHEVRNTHKVKNARF